MHSDVLQHFIQHSDPERRFHQVEIAVGDLHEQVHCPHQQNLQILLTHGILQSLLPHLHQIDGDLILPDFEHIGAQHRIEHVYIIPIIISHFHGLR